MKPITTSLLFIAIVCLSSYGQVKEASQNLKKQVNQMGTAFVKGDYKTFATYTYPLILESMGGITQMVEILQRSTNDMKLRGISFGNITFDEPAKIIIAGKELQSTISQHTEIKMPQGRLVNTSTLIAVSKDNGDTWTFIDTSNKDIKTLRQAIPNLSSQLNIPPPPPPVRYNN